MSIDVYFGWWCGLGVLFISVIILKGNIEIGQILCNTNFILNFSAEQAKHVAYLKIKEKH